MFRWGNTRSIIGYSTLMGYIWVIWRAFKTDCWTPSPKFLNNYISLGAPKFTSLSAQVIKWCWCYLSKDNTFRATVVREEIMVWNSEMCFVVCCFFCCFVFGFFYTKIYYFRYSRHWKLFEHNKLCKSTKSVCIIFYSE